MQHLDEGTIHSWLDGALSADEATRVEAHVAECPQCAATVAEARGFIAASSRILTALDHVPRGVLPAAPPAKWGNRAVWRAAAAVLVVAAGSLVVFRNGGREASIPTTNSNTALNAITTTAPASPMVNGGMRTTSEPAPPVRMREESSQQATSSQNRAINSSPPGAVLSEKRAAAPQPKVAALESTVRGKVFGAVGGEPAPPTQITGATAAASGSVALMSRVAGVSAAAMDAANGQVPLKVIGTPRRLGARVTLYEVAPGDTVMLTEVIDTYLEAVVVTGAGTTRTLGGQSPGKAGVSAPAQRTDTATESARDSLRVAGVVRAPGVTLSAPAAPLRVEVSSGVTTIIWPDPITGNTLQLSGRLPEAQLLQIRIRILRERAAAAAAAAAKKKP